MPPIDPAILRERATLLTERFPEAGPVAMRVRGLLNDYADRTYRPSPKLARGMADNIYRVPPPRAAGD